ncbi:MAG: DUF2059 domain-containing protein [Pseudoxanthomonas sp.]|nr:DUF2059 domain-containing protein [Pseudoxanthomonas sp.]
MTKWIALPCLWLAAALPVANATESAGRSPEMAAAVELLALMDMETMVAGMQEQLHGMMRAQMQEQLRGSAADVDCPAVRTVVDSFAGDTARLIGQSLSGDAFLSEVAQVYVDVFTLDEIEAVAEFYRTPVGRKMLDKMPELMQRSMEISQRMVADMMPGIESLVGRFTDKIATAEAVCASAD